MASRKTAKRTTTAKAARKAPKRSANKQAARQAVTKKAAAPKRATTMPATPAQVPTAKRAAPKWAKAAAAGPALIAGPQVGDPAPDFKLLDDQGRTQSLGNFRGKKVVLYFYPKDFTGGCTQQACDFRDNLGRIQEKAAVVLGVSADSVDSHKRFKEKQGLTYTLLSDPERQAIGAYGVWQEKSLYGRTFMGIVRTTVIIDEEGRVAKVFPKVKVGGHVDEVLAAL